MKLQHAAFFAALAFAPMAVEGAGFNAVLQGQSATAPSSHTATGVYITTSLQYWEELDAIPFRVYLTGGPVTGKVITVQFDHQKTLGGITNPAIQNLTNFMPSPGVTITSGPTLNASDPDVWTYTFTVDLAGANGDVEFSGNLSAGAHNFGGASLNVGGSPSLGNLSIMKPAAAPGSPNLSVVKAGPATAVPGGTVTYTLSYTNVSALPMPSAATGVQLTDVLPAGLTYVPGSASCTGTCTGTPAIAGNTIVWNLGTIALGATGSQTFQATIDPAAPDGSTFVNTATILSAENDPVPTDNTSTLTTTVVATLTGLSVSDATGTYGGTVTLQATLTNTATSTGISGQLIVFTLNGTAVGNATTNGSGVATLSGASLGTIPVGTYPGGIGSGVEATFAGAAPYAGSTGSAQLIVTPQALTIKATDQNKTYGQAFSFTGTEFTVIGLVGTDAVTSVTLTSSGADAAATVGHYDLVPSDAIGTGLGNYLITYANGTFNVAPKSLTITADNQSKVYGALFSFVGTEFGTTGLIGTDSVNSVTLSSTGAAAPAAVGNYDIVPSNAIGTGLNNYTIGYVNGTLVVGGKILTITANNQSKAYGDIFTFSGTEFSASGLMGSDSVTSVTLTSSGAAATAGIGGYDIVPSGAVGTGLGNYLITYTSGTLTVTARAVTITADAKTKAYGETDPALTYQVTGGSVAPGDTFTGALSRVAGEDVGTYAITQGTVALNGNYTLSFVSANLTVGQRAVTITADAKSKAYGETDPALTYQVTSGSLAPGDAFTGALNRIAGEDAGTYAINQGTVALNSNYALSFVTANLVIGHRAVTITADAKSKGYGDADPTLTYQVTSGSLVSGDTFAGALSRVAGEDVGTYAINQGTVALSGNYALSFVSANLTISHRAVTITADAKSKGYGEVDPALTYQVTSGTLVPGDTFTGALNRVAGENVGTYPINQGTVALSDNYALSFVSANLTITARGVTITADAKFKGYGEADPALTFQITGGSLAPGDTFAGALDRVPGEDVGTYAINQGTVALSGNYTLSFVGANLTIGHRAVTITADAKSKSYGEADPALTYQITGGSLAPGDTFTGTLSRLVGENVGTYAINQGTVALNGNYTLSFVGANLTIGARSVTIAADAKSKSYGEADPALTYQVTSGSLVAGDTFTGALNRMTGEDVGIYAINQGTVALNGNYTLSFVGANFTIGHRAVTITADAKSKSYGDADPALTYQITSGSLAGTDAFTGSLTRNPGENVGTYAITRGTVALSGNYALTFIGNNLSIGHRAVTITADAKSKVYGTIDPALTYQITSGSLVVGDALSGALTRAPGESVGTYQIEQGTLSLGGNYALTYVPANLTINHAVLTITANDKSRNYGENNPVFDASYSGFVNGETLATSGVSGVPSLTTTATATSPIGTYPITASIGTLTSLNYSFVFANGTLTISGRAITVTADAKTKVYNTAEPALTYKITSGSLASGDSFTGNLTRAPGENVGSYAIQQGTLALNGNYALTFNGASFTITKADQTITFGALSNKKFGDPAFNVAATATSGLPVTFSVASGPATIVGTLVTVTGSGGVTIRAEQPGNENYNAAMAVDQSFTVGKADQTISFAPLSNKTFGDPPVKMTVTASSGLPVSCDVTSGPGSMTTYYRVVISGAGTITVRATQDGNENYNAASPVEQSFVVGKANTVTGVTSTPNPSMLGDPVEFTATMSSAASGMTGTVQFRDKGANMGDPQPVTGNTATLKVSSLTTGEHEITAEYSGDNNFFGSTGTLLGANGEKQIVMRPAALLNLATRLLVRTHDNVMIGGFIMTGIIPKKVIVRGLGPSLAEAGIQGFLVDPVIELHGPDGALLVTNDNWKTTQQAEIEASGLAPKSDLESAIVATLPPAAYTVIIRGKNEAMGVGVVEVYDLDPLSESDLRNVSTRGFVADKEDVLIGGFTLGTHQGPVKILLRAHGVCLKNWGLTEVLTDPMLHLHDANGTQLIVNDNWKDDPQQATAIEQSTMPPDDLFEAAAVITLQPGAYTVIVEGNGHTGGNGIVEVFPLN
jgi:uncharacterized repeat protein (TIGR01451 family)